MRGYDIDIAGELAKQLGMQIEFIRTDVAGRVAMLQSHKFAPPAGRGSG